MRVLSRVVLLALILSLSPIFVSAISAVPLQRGTSSSRPQGAAPFASTPPPSRPRRFRQRTQFSLVDYRRSDREHLRVGARRPKDQQVFSYGVNLLTIPTPYKPGGVQVGTDGTIYVADYFGGQVYRYSASGTDLGQFALTSTVQADFMTFDAGGNLYVTDSILEVVRRVSPTGVDLGDFVAGFPGPRGSHSTLKATCTSQVSTRASSKSTPHRERTGRFALIGLSASMFGIAFDASGNLAMANFAEGSIHSFSPAGDDLGVFASTA